MDPAGVIGKQRMETFYNVSFLSPHPLCISWQTRDLRALKLDGNPPFLIALPSC